MSPFLPVRKPLLRRRAAAGLLAGVALAASGRLAAEPPEPISPLPLTVDEDPQRVALGGRLFRDTLLSRNNNLSCVGCHPLARGGVDGRPRAIAADGRQRLRNTPTVWNVRFNLYLNWDGGHESLTAHTDALVQNPAVMGMDWPTLLARLKASPSYVAEFRQLGPEGITRERVLEALVAFERSLITPNARIDRYLRGQLDALTADEGRGYRLFKSYGCIACHQGMNIGGNVVQRFGVFAVPDLLGLAADPPDPGRIRVTQDPRDQFVFRVPSLRNVALTAPYFHDGRAPTLEVAVRVMAQAQLGRTLTAEDIRLIAAFLRTLTGEVDGRIPTPAGTEARP